MTGFNITYEIVTQESAEYGDYAETGFLFQDLPFREALQRFENERDGAIIEADCCPVKLEYPPRWFTDSGNVRSVSLHLPQSITASSAMRIARLLNCYGVR